MPRLLRWWTDTVLPFWAETGVDHRHGGFVERLDAGGRPDATAGRKRLLVQARQVAVFSQAAMLCGAPWAQQTAASGIDHLCRHYWEAAPGRTGWVHSLTTDGAPADRSKTSYDLAFVLFALAWWYRASGDDTALGWIARTVDVLDDRFADAAHGGLHERVDGDDAKTPRRQNPHMHLLEAWLALFEATGDLAWRDRAAALVELFLTHWFDAGNGSLGEYFTEDWRPAPGHAGRLREPGHHFEWVWLLHQYRRLSGDDRAAEPAERLYRFAVRHGVAAMRDGARATVDAVDRDGIMVRGDARLWPQTETVKAHLTMHEKQRDPAAADQASGHLAMMFGRYLDLGSPHWREHLDDGGRPIVDTMPATSLYHLSAMVSEAVRVLHRDRAVEGVVS